MVYTTINVTGNAQLLLAGKPLNPGQLGLGFTLANNDETNTVWVGTKQNMTPTDSGVVPCAPLGSIPIDAGSTTYIVSAGPTVQCFLIPGGGTWAPSPAQVAAQIAALGLATLTAQNTQIGQLSSAPASTIADDVANQGTPLLHGMDSPTGGTKSGVIAANSTTTIGPFAFTKPGYFVNVVGSIAAGATSPFMVVRFSWSFSGISIAEEDWVIPATTTASNPLPHLGRGMVKGSSLTIQLVNTDPADSITYGITVVETTHSINRDDWRPVVAPLTVYTVPAFTIPTAPITENLLASVAPNVGAGLSQAYLLPLYAGQVNFLLAAATGANLQVTFSTPTPLPVGYGGADAFIWQNTAITENNVSLVLPRIPCVLNLKNTAGAAQVCTAVGTILEYQ